MGVAGVVLELVRACLLGRMGEQECLQAKRFQITIDNLILSSFYEQDDKLSAEFTMKVSRAILPNDAIFLVGGSVAMALQWK